MDARTGQEVSTSIAMEDHVIRIGEHGRITVGGDPHQGDPLAGSDRLTTDLDISRGRPVVGDERTIGSQDLPAGGCEQIRPSLRFA